MKSLLHRIRYLLFRWFYTLSHLLFFVCIKHKDWRKTPAVKPRNLLILCGIETNIGLSIDKLRTFVQLVRKKYPTIEFVLFSKLEEKPDIVIEGLRVITWEYQERARLLGPLARALYRKGQYDEAQLKDIAKNATAIIDLGHCQINANLATGWTANVLANIIFAKKWGLPFYLFPQTFGPLNYPVQMAAIFRLMIRKILPYAELVCVRESAGIETLRVAAPKAKTLLAPELLLFKGSQKQASHTDKKRIVLIPDENLLRNKNQLKAVLIQLIKSSFSDISIHCYDPNDCRLAERQLPEISSILGTGKCRISKPDEFQLDFPADTIYVTTKYHTAIHCLLHGSPAVFIAPNDIAENMYSNFDLLAQFTCSTEELKPLLCELIQASVWLQHQAAIQTRLNAIQDLNPIERLNL